MEYKHYSRISAISTILDMANAHHANYRNHLLSFTKFHEEAKILGYYSVHLEEFLSKNDDSYVHNLLKANLETCKAAIHVIIFYSMFLEAFIYDYGSIYLSDNYMRDHLDRLDFISKWVIVPKLVTGKDIDKSGPFFSSIKKIHRDRNQIIHHKTKPFNISNLESEEKYAQELIKSANNAVKCAKLCVETIEKISPEFPCSVIFKVKSDEET